MQVEEWCCFVLHRAEGLVYKAASPEPIHHSARVAQLWGAGGLGAASWGRPALAVPEGLELPSPRCFTNQWIQELINYAAEMKLSVNLAFCMSVDESSPGSGLLPPALLPGLPWLCNVGSMWDLEHSELSSLLVCCHSWLAQAPSSLAVYWFFSDEDKWQNSNLGTKNKTS